MKRISYNRKNEKSRHPEQCHPELVSGLLQPRRGPEGRSLCLSYSSILIEFMNKYTLLSFVRIYLGERKDNLHYQYYLFS